MSLKSWLGFGPVPTTESVINDLHTAHNRISQASGARWYGDGGTIHESGDINIVIDRDGNVVQVWYRCLSLPFTVTLRENGQASTIQPNTYVSGIEYVQGEQ